MKEGKNFLAVGLYSLILVLIIFFLPWERVAFLSLSLIVIGRCLFSRGCWGEIFAIGLIFDFAWGHHLGRSSLFFLFLAFLVSIARRNFLFSKNRSLKIPLK